jgi:hypothetical protein
MTRSQWAQDWLMPPVRQSTAHESAALAKYGSDHYAYVFNYAIGRNQKPQTFNFNARIDTSSDFWMTQIVCSVFDNLTNSNADVPVGFVSVTDGLQNYEVVSDLWSGAFFQTLTPDSTENGNYAQRAIWPVPYGFGAGSAFRVSVRDPNGGGPASDLACQIMIEGFKVYDIGDAHGSTVPQ